jgi:hypothetical protein
LHFFAPCESLAAFVVKSLNRKAKRHLGILKRTTTELGERLTTVLSAGCFLSSQGQEVLRPLDRRRDLAKEFLQVFVAVHEVNL